MFTAAKNLGQISKNLGQLINNQILKPKYTDISYLTMRFAVMLIGRECERSLLASISNTDKDGIDS